MNLIDTAIVHECGGLRPQQTVNLIDDVDMHECRARERKGEREKGEPQPAEMTSCMGKGGHGRASPRDNILQHVRLCHRSADTILDKPKSMVLIAPVTALGVPEPQQSLVLVRPHHCEVPCVIAREAREITRENVETQKEKAGAVRL